MITEDPLSASSKARSRSGVIAAALAFLAWGVLPVYWKALASVPPLAVVAHRVVWSLVFTVLLVTVTGRWGEIRPILRSPRQWAWYTVSSILLTANWLVFIWGIANGYVIQCSLGYFINPLASVLLGCLFLREQPRAWQVVSFVLAGAGVAVLVGGYGQVPWVAIGLAGTFSFYGLLRKTARLESLPGLMLETAIVSLPAVAFLSLTRVNGLEIAGDPSLRVRLPLLVGAGVVTSLPLLLFAHGARRIRLSSVGFIHYLTPTCMFVLGAFVYRDRDKLTLSYMITFALIWAGLAIYSWDSLRAGRSTS